ncbi:hypothetical protein D3C78_740460 [compost metagenome]
MCCNVIFQNFVCILIKQLIDSDELTGINKLIGQYCVSWCKNEIRKLFAGSNGKLKLLSVLIVICRIPSIFMLHTQCFKHPAIVNVVFFGITLNILLRHQYGTELDRWIVFAFCESSICFGLGIIGSVTIFGILIRCAATATCCESDKCCDREKRPHFLELDHSSIPPTVYDLYKCNFNNLSGMSSI